MAYNHGREERKWRIQKEAEETVLRKCGVDESIIEEIRTYDRAEFNSNRRFYRWTSDFGQYLEGMAELEPFVDVKTVADLLNEIENENLHHVLLSKVRPPQKKLRKILQASNTARLLMSYWVRGQNLSPQTVDKSVLGHKS